MPDTVLQRLAQYPYHAPWWLRGRHAQTMYGPLLRRPAAAALVAERWTTPDGDELDVYRSPDFRGERPTLLILHGLEGSVRSHYVQGLAGRFHDARWNVAAFEHRSCGGRMNRARRLYHSGETSDLAFVVDEFLARSPTRLFIAGFSLGGNLVAKWLGERGDRVPDRVVAGAAVSPPFDLTVSGPHLDRALGGLYSRHFLQTLIPKAIAKERQYPGCVDIAALRRSRTFREFDTHGTAALHGFRDAEDYWARVSCGQYLPQVRRPLLLIAAADDPFNPGCTHPHAVVNRSPFLYPLFPARGGHVGFVYGRSPFRARYWAEEQIGRFFGFAEARAGGGNRKTP